jgi:hypothetical protein
MQPHLWHDLSTDWSSIRDYGTNNAVGSTFHAPYDIVPDAGYFVSAFPNYTDTGVLREHVMRLNSSAECHAIDETSFPATCTGPDPFVASYDSSNDISDNKYNAFVAYNDFSIDICVPGDLSASPWTLSRDRQDISEDLYIKVLVGSETCQYCGLLESWGMPTNFTVRCNASTTRGYFELPNWQNDFTPGPLLSEWPDVDTLKKDFNVSQGI